MTDLSFDAPKIFFNIKHMVNFECFVITYLTNNFEKKPKNENLFII